MKSIDDIKVVVIGPELWANNTFADTIEELLHKRGDQPPVSVIPFSKVTPKNAWDVLITPDSITIERRICEDVFMIIDKLREKLPHTPIVVQTDDTAIRARIIHGVTFVEWGDYSKAIRTALGL